MSLGEFVRRNRAWFFAAAAGFAGVGFFASEAGADVGRIVSSVFVTNSANNPIPVQDVDHRNAVEQSGMATCTAVIEAGQQVAYGQCTIVPSDKLFVIEHVSARTFVPRDHPPLYLTLAHARGTSMAGYISTPLVSHREKGVDGNDVVTVSQPVKTYAGPGTPVMCYAGRTSAHSDNTAVTCVVSGHYEDL